MNNRTLPLLITLSLVMTLCANAVMAKSPKAKKKTPIYYLSLGTSLAAGVQADPETGESIVTDVSYPGLIADALKKDIKRLRHINLGCPGETSETFIYGGICEYPNGSQLDEAIAFLKSKGKYTALITIDLGANDILACSTESGIDLECFDETIFYLSMDLKKILKRLRKAAGRRTKFIGMDYYNPLLVSWFIDEALAAQAAMLQSYFNGALFDVYDRFRIPVADVSGAFMSDNFSDANRNDVPDNVDIICAWTWMCAFENIHPNDTGYGVIAEEFLNELPPIWMYKPHRHR